MVDHSNTSAGISVRGKEAQIKGGVWVCEDLVLKGRLNSMSPPSGYFPYPFWQDLRAAELAAEELGGLLLWCGLPPKDDYPYPPCVVF
jgi:hypothetical protein